MSIVQEVSPLGLWRAGREPATPKINCDECGAWTGKYRFDMVLSDAQIAYYRAMGVPDSKDAPPTLCGRCTGIDIT